MKREKGAEVLVATSVIALVSSLVFLIMLTPTVFVAFAFLLITTISILITMDKGLIEKKVRIASRTAVNIGIALVFLSSAIFLMTFQVFRAPVLEGPATAIAILIGSFLPGYLLVRTLDLPYKAAPLLEVLVFSYCYSLLFTTFLATGIMCLEAGSRGPIVSSLFLAMAIFLVVLEWLRYKGLLGQGEEERMQQVELHAVDVMALLPPLALSFYIMAVIHPSMVNFPGLDIAEHMRRVLVFLRDKSSYTYPEPAYHFPIAMMYVAGGSPDPHMFLRAISALGIIVLPALYALSKAVLGKLDVRAQAMASLVFSFFSGLGWLLFLVEAPYPDYQAYLAVHEMALSKTYFSIPCSPPLDLTVWYRPRTLGLTALMAFMVLMARRPISRKKLASLGLLMALMFLSHLPEFFMAIAVLAFLTVLWTDMEVGKQAVLACSISLAIAAVAYGLFQATLGLRTPSKVVSPFLHTIALLMTLLSVGLALLARRVPLKLGSKLRSYGPKIGTGIALCVLVVFATGVAAWLNQLDDFNLRAVGGQDGIYFLPWFFYPMLAGVALPLTVLGLLGSATLSAPLRLIVALCVVAVLLGRLVSIANLYITFVGFYEARFPLYLFTGLAILAPLGLLEIWRRLPGRGLAMTGLKAAVLSALVFCGSMTTFYSLEYLTLTYSGDPIGPAEEEALAFLRDLMEVFPRSTILTVTKASSRIVRWALPARIVVDYYRMAIWRASSLEASLSLLFDERADSYFIYLHARDMRELAKMAPEDSAMKRLISFLPKVFENGEVSVYWLPAFSPPRPDSETALVVGLDEDEPTYAYLMLSTAYYPYTTALDVDEGVFSSDILLMPYDGVPASAPLDELMAWVRAGGTLLVMNKGGGGPLLDLLATQEVRITVNATSPDVLLYRPEETSPLESLRAFSESLEFVVENAREECSPLVVADDNQSAFWIPFVSGHGSIGKPVFHDDPGEKVRGANALRVEVGEGPYSEWGLAHWYKEPQDWSAFDFISFYWYGRGDGAEYTFWVMAPDTKNRLRFIFKDEWAGWKRVILPLKAPDGSYVVNGITIHKHTKGAPDLSQVLYISLRLGGGNPNLKGVWRLDRLVVDVGRWVNLTVELENARTLEVYSLSEEGESFLARVSENASATAPADSMVFSGGLSGDVLFGPGTCVMRLNSSITDGRLSVLLSIKTPPGHTDECKTALRLLGIYEGFLANELVVGDTTWPLPTPVYCANMTVRNGTTVLAWFSNGSTRAPFLLCREEGEGLFIYMNIYPMLRTVGSHDIIDVLRVGWAVLARAVPKFDVRTVGTSPAGTFNLLFSRFTAEGNVVVEGRPLIITGEDVSLSYTAGGSEMRLTGLSMAWISGEDLLELRAEKLDGGGAGFYVRLESSGAVEVHGQDMRMRLFFANGSSLDVGLDGSATVLVHGENITSFIREPRILARGITTIRDAHVSSWPEKRIWDFVQGLLKGKVPTTTLRVYDKTLTFHGEVDITFLVGGGFSMANVGFEGSVQVSPPMVAWDEWASLLKATPFAILFALTFFLGYACAKVAKRPPERLHHEEPPEGPGEALMSGPEKKKRILMILDPAEAYMPLRSEEKLKIVVCDLDPSWEVHLFHGNNIEYKSLPCGYKVHTIPFGRRPNSLLFRALYLFSCLFLGAKVVRKHDIGLVCCRTGHLYLGLIAYAVSRLTHRKCLIRVNEDDVLALRFFLSGRFPDFLIELAVALARRVEEFLLKRADWIVTHGPGDFKRISKLTDRITFVPLGVDTALFYPFPEEKARKLKEAIVGDLNKKVVLFVGRIERVKDLPSLLRAVGKLAPRYPDILLLVVGRGSIEEDMKRLARELGIADKVVFVGAVRHRHLPVYYNIADVYVLPSIHEQWSNTIMEAMACGLPVVATNVGGNPALIEDGETGLLVRPGDVEALAEKIEKVLFDVELRRRLVVNALRKIRAYSFRETGRRYRLIMEMLMGGRGNEGSHHRS